MQQTLQQLENYLKSTVNQVPTRKGQDKNIIKQILQKINQSATLFEDEKQLDINEIGLKHLKVLNELEALIRQKHKKDSDTKSNLKKEINDLMNKLQDNENYINHITKQQQQDPLEKQYYSTRGNDKQNTGRLANQQFYEQNEQEMRQTITTLKLKNKALKSKFAEIEHDYDIKKLDFESQINNLKAVLNKMESTTTNLKFDTLKDQETYKKAFMHYELQEQDLTKKDSQIQVLEENRCLQDQIITDLTFNFENAQKTCENLQLELEEAKGQLFANQSEMKELVNNKTQMETEFQEIIESEGMNRNQQLFILQKRVAKQKSELKNLSELNETLDTEARSLQIKYSEVKSSEQQLIEELKTNQAELRKVNDEVFTLKKDLKIIKSEKQEMLFRIQKESERINQEQAKSIQFEKENERLQTLLKQQIEEGNTKFSESQRNFQKMTESYQLQEQLIRKLENQVQFMEEENKMETNKLNSQLNNQVKTGQQNQEMVRELATLKQRLKNSEEEREELRSEIQKLSVMNSELNNHTESINQQVSNLIQDKCTEMHQYHDKIGKLQALEEIKGMISKHKKEHKNKQ